MPKSLQLSKKCTRKRTAFVLAQRILLIHHTTYLSILQVVPYAVDRDFAIASDKEWTFHSARVSTASRVGTRITVSCFSLRDPVLGIE